MGNAMESVRKLVQTVWIGGLLTTAGLLIWFAWHERLFAMGLAARLFPAVAGMGMVAGGLLLLIEIMGFGINALKTRLFWCLLLLWLLAFVAWFGVRQTLQYIGFMPNFRIWHGTAVSLYMLQCFLGAYFVIRR